MAPVVAVTTVTATGAKRAICSCQWEGEDRRTPREAWQDKARHEREHHLTPVPTGVHNGPVPTTERQDPA